MDLLEDPWIPVRAGGGSGQFRLLTYEELLCGTGEWTVSLPRDDLELACLQLLTCMTQAMFTPDTEAQWRERLARPLPPEAFADGVAPCREWFDLDHPTQPFMQTRGIQSKDITPIQKLLIGLPEGNNHAFFNEVGEVRRLGGAMAALALFNQASNCPSFGGGFKGSLRGGSPVTTLVDGGHLRETVWRNVLTLGNVQKRWPDYQPDPATDLPTWVRPIREKEAIHAPLIGLVRGLFWQPAHVELIRHGEEAPCDLLGGEVGPVYSGFRKEKFGFTVDGVWPHPHGAMIDTEKKGVKERKFVSFTTAAPAWTQLSEFVVPRTLGDKDTKEGCTPAGPVMQVDELLPGAMHLIVGGYRTNQASVIERRHELVSLASGWAVHKGFMKDLIDFGKDARLLLRGKLYFASQGHKGHKDKGMKGIGAPIQDMADKLFYARSESLIQETFANEYTFQERKQAKAEFFEKVCAICRTIYEELTNPYTHKPELIPIIAWARRSLNGELSKMTEKISP